MIQRIDEMSRGKWKKFTKGKAIDMAKDRLMTNLSIAYYGFENDDEFQALSEEDQELIMNYINEFGEKMAKAIGRNYYTQ